MILAGFYTGNLKQHDCSEQYDASWGCFHPVKKPRWNLPCWVCFGKKGNTDCDICAGHGAVGQLRCPNHVDTGTMQQLFSFYTIFSNHNALPFGTCILDQTRYFYNIVKVFPSYELAWDRVETEKRKKIDAMNKGRKAKPNGTR